MKTAYLKTVVAILIMLPLMMNAQTKKEQHQARKKEIDVKRIAYITQKLELTSEEAQVFWPVYNEFQKKKEDLMKENRGKKKPDALDGLSEQELNNMADEDIKRAMSMVELRKEYNDKFKTVLPIIKVVKLYEAEKTFKKELLRDLSYERRAKYHDQIPE